MGMAILIDMSGFDGNSAATRSSTAESGSPTNSQRTQEIFRRSRELLAEFDLVDASE